MELLNQCLEPNLLYWNDRLWPAALDVWSQLQVPSWEVYNPVLQECMHDVWKASQSSSQLAYLTFRPLVILSWMLLQVAWGIGRVFFRIFMEQAWISLQKGLVQLKAAAIWFYHFQMSLSRTELLGEVALVGLLISSYYFYKWIRRQTYWERFVRWYSVKKQRAIESTTKLINRVARVSLILAMALPHMAFVGGYVGLKILFPSFVKWLAYDTYSTALISVWYPLVMTLSWIHEKRQARINKYRDGSFPQRTRSTNGSASKAGNEQKSSPLRSTASKDSQDSQRKSFFSFGKSSKPETPVKSPDSKSSSPSKSPFPMKSPLNLFTDEPEEATLYWLRYWVVYALVQCVGTFTTLVPVFGMLVARHRFVMYIAHEVKLLFFVWLFTMEKIIGAAIVEEDAFMAQSMPLRLIHDYITPVLLEFETVVSEVVTKQTWRTMVYKKAERVFDILVMVKMISETRKEWLLSVVNEGRTLLVPSLCLFMPGFITQFGVAYVQFVVPSSKAARVLKRRARSEASELLYLQYWVLHCLIGGLLSYFSTLLWFIPFSTHAVFVLWCYLSLTKSILQLYHVLETELVAFGLLAGESPIEIHETKTAQVFQAVYSRLPSAADSSLEGLEKEPTGEFASQRINRSISVDSQKTNVEVSIREAQVKRSASSDAEVDSATPNKDETDRVSKKLDFSEGDESIPPSASAISEASTAASSPALSDASSGTPSDSTGLRRSLRQRKQMTAH